MGVAIIICAIRWAVHYRLKSYVGFILGKLYCMERAGQILSPPVARAGNNNKWLLDAELLLQDLLVIRRDAWMKNALLGGKVNSGNSLWMSRLISDGYRLPCNESRL